MSEKRMVEATEVRTKDDAEDMVINGYALKYNTWSQDLGGFIETIDKQALDNADMSDVRCLIDHDNSRILGRTSSGTLDLVKDDVGLRFECTLPNTTYAKDLYENVRVGNINQCSFGFEVDRNGDELRFNKEKSIYQRIIKAFKRISDVTVTSTPAYKDTDVTPVLRSIENIEEENRVHKEKEKLKMELDLIDL